MKKVGIIIGGPSVEHEVSIITGLQIYDNIDKKKFDPSIIYIDEKGQWHIGDILSNIETYKKKKDRDLDRVIPWFDPNHPAKLILTAETSGKGKLFSKKKEPVFLDVIIPAGHGTMMEDGALQGFLEMCNVPYCFSDMKSSAIGMDKVCMKQIFQAYHMPIVPYQWFYRSEFENNQEIVLEKIEALGYPLMVKPANLGSSIGINKANDKQEVLKWIEVAGHYDKKIIVEKYIEDPREINCSVLGFEKDIQASLCEEPIGWEEFLKFEDKYLNKNGPKSDKAGQNKRKIPANLEQEQARKIQEMAKKAFESIEAAGVARVDFLISHDQIFVNEINTVPGSAAFYLWEPSGMPFMELISNLIEIAERRHQQKQKNMTHYDVDLINNLAKKNKLQ